MSSLFGKLFNEKLKEGEIVVHQEAIQPQLNDWFVTDLINLSNEIVTLAKSKRDREIRIPLSQIEANITKRFGFNVKLVQDTEYSDFETWPIMLKPNHIFLKALGEDDWVDQVMDDIQGGETEFKSSVKNLDDIRWNTQDPDAPYEYALDENGVVKRDIAGEPIKVQKSEPMAWKDYNSIFKQYVTNMKIGLSRSGIGGITIDLEKAYCNGVDKEIFGTTLFHAGQFIREYPDLTPEEFAAILLHEIGHHFISIENTRANIDNNLTLVTTLKDICAINGKPFKRGLIRAYETITKNPVINMNTISDRDIALSLIEWVAKKNNLSVNKSHKINNESQADLFVSRFGLSGALASALTKTHFKDWNGSVLNGYGATMLMLQWQTVITVTGLIIKASFAFAAVPVYTVGAILTLINMIWSYNFMSPDVRPSMETYDKFRMRLQKLKNDCIRVLRTSKLDIKTRTFLIEDVEKVMNFIEKAPRPTEGAFAWLWRKISRGAQTMFDMKRTEELWEQLQENDLYLAKTKIDAVINAPGVVK